MRGHNVAKVIFYFVMLWVTACIFPLNNGFAGSPKSTRTMPMISVINAPAAWAHTSLLNYIFMEEYRVVRLHVQKLATKDREYWLISDEAYTLFIRAFYAFDAATRRTQKISGQDQLYKLFGEHYLAIEKQNKKSPKDKIRKLPTDPKKTADGSGEAQLLPQIVNTFDREEFKQAWQRFSVYYSAPSPTCPLAIEDVRGFAAGQKALTAGNRQPRPDDVRTLVKGWDDAKVQCLVFALMAADGGLQEQEGFEPIYLLRTIDQGVGITPKRDLTITLTHTLRLLQKMEYPSALSVLLAARDLDPTYRLLYDMVQRIYGYRQKGAGDVAIQGL